MLCTTLSKFTSPPFASKEKRCLCCNYSRPWSDWAPTTSTRQELATEESRDLKSIYPAPQKRFCCVFGFHNLFRSFFLTLQRAQSCAFLFLLAQEEKKILNYATLTSLEAASVVPANPLKSVWIIVLLVIINSCGNCITGTTADAQCRRSSPSGWCPRAVGSSFSASESVFVDNCELVCIYAWLVDSMTGEKKGKYSWGIPEFTAIVTFWTVVCRPCLHRGSLLWLLWRKIHCD